MRRPRQTGHAAEQSVDESAGSARMSLTLEVFMGESLPLTPALSPEYWGEGVLVHPNPHPRVLG